MSEGKIITAVVKWIGIVLLVFILQGLIKDTIEQKNWIMDLQRRIAEAQIEACIEGLWDAGCSSFPHDCYIIDARQAYAKACQPGGQARF